MTTVFFILMAVAMAGVLATLLVGVVSMAKGGDFNKKYSNKLMQARVYLQGAAIMFFFLALLSTKK